MKVAGLTLSDRLRKSASQAGFDEVVFLSENLSGDFHCSGRESSLVLLETGYLPNTDYLRSLKSLGQSQGQFVIGINSPVLVYRSSSPEEWIKKVRANPPGLIAKLENEFPTTTVPVGEGVLYEIGSLDRVSRTEQELFKSLVKDTEGFMSRHVERKISLTISRFLVNSPITPNQMTIISVLIGVLGAFFMGAGQGAWQIIGASLFLAHSILDGCDGELARIRFQQSRFGGLLDYWGDNVVHSAVFYALAYEWSRRAAAFYPYLLGGLAIFGTLASASWIYWKTMREKSSSEPLYVSVSTSKEKSRVVEVADFLSRRDFIYLVLILAFFHKLDWFLALSAAGAPFFFAVLVWIHYQEKQALS